MSRFHWVLPKALAVAFWPQSISDMNADALHQARRDLHGAELNAEHAVSHRDMLKARVDRLEVAVGVRIGGNWPIVGVGPSDAALEQMRKDTAAEELHQRRRNKQPSPQ